MNMLIFGLGYTALFYARAAQARHAITGTVRRLEKAEVLRAEGLDTRVWAGGEADPSLVSALLRADVCLVSVPPGAHGDPVLAHLSTQLAQAPQLQHIIYLSTVGVYGDHQGAWVDEDTVVRPVSARSVERVAAETAWRAFAKLHSKKLHILRLSGIYGPGRSGFDKLRNGTARRLIKADQVFNRIHVADIAQAIEAALQDTRPGCHIWNVTDNEPAPPQDVVAFAAGLMQIPPPPEQDFATADLTPMARSFYGENKRVANTRFTAEAGVTLAYPTYREGLQAIWSETGD